MRRKQESNTKNLDILSSMKPIQDSILFKDAPTAGVYNRFYNTAKRNGMAIIVRKVVGGTRMWREF